MVNEEEAETSTIGTEIEEGTQNETPQPTPSVPACSSAAAHILKSTSYVILPFGWSRKWYTHEEEEDDNDDGLKKKKGRPKKKEKMPDHTVYYVTPSGRVLLSEEEAFEYLHREDIFCRCYLPIDGLLFNEVFNFEYEIGSLSLMDELESPGPSRCLSWCQTMSSNAEDMRNRLESTRLYIELEKASDKVSARRRNVHLKKAEKADVLVMLSRSNELIVMEEGDVFIRDLTDQHLKHLSYELWKAGVQMPTTTHSLQAKVLVSKVEEEEAHFAAFFGEPSADQDGDDLEGHASHSQSTPNEEEESTSLIFFCNRPTTTENSSGDTRLMAYSLTTDGTVSVFEETSTPEAVEDVEAAEVTEEDENELEEVVDSVEQENALLDDLMSEVETSEEEDEESINLSSEHSSDYDHEDESEEFLLSDIEVDGHFDDEETEVEEEDEVKAEEVATKEPSVENGEKIEMAESVLHFDADDLMTEVDDDDLLHSLMTDDEDDDALVSETVKETVQDDVFPRPKKDKKRRKRKRIVLSALRQHKKKSPPHRKPSPTPKARQVQVEAGRRSTRNAAAVAKKRLTELKRMTDC